MKKEVGFKRACELMKDGIEMLNYQSDCIFRWNVKKMRWEVKHTLKSKWCKMKMLGVASRSLWYEYEKNGMWSRVK